jgi:hypothetical protein
VGAITQDRLMTAFGVRYLDEGEMRRWRTGAYPMEERMQEMYAHLEERMVQQQQGQELNGQTPGQIRVGARVRLKGDDVGHWMTVKRIEDAVRDPNNPNSPEGLFATCAYWTKQAGGGLVLAEQVGFRFDCLTTEPPVAVKRPSWGRTVKTPAAAKKAVTRAKRR